MKPEVMTSEISTVPIAQAQRERRMGRKNLMPERTIKVMPAVVPYLDQSIGALYGIRTGVYCESCSARGPASNPLYGARHLGFRRTAVEYSHTYLEKSYTIGAVRPLAGRREPSAGRWMCTTGADDICN